MDRPQQPEIARSGLGATDPASVKSEVHEDERTTEPRGKVPEDNRPGHHPEHEQDKPDLDPTDGP